LASNAECLAGRSGRHNLGVRAGKHNCAGIRPRSVPESFPEPTGSGFSPRPWPRQDCMPVRLWTRPAVSPGDPAGIYTAVMDGIGRMTENEREQFEERAAIVEFEGGWPRAIAEAEAKRILGRCRWHLAALFPGDRRAAPAGDEPDTPDESHRTSGSGVPCPARVTDLSRWRSTPGDGDTAVRCAG